jgi:hypothetical protein
MEWNKKILLSIIFIFLINGVLAVQPTQNFNKLFLSPFYLPSTTQNIENTFLVNLNPPDKISNVLSAMISFDVWLNPSINFTLKVNNQKCSNPEYYISTTYAGAGKNQVSFDCSNVIKQSGNYTIILKANKDTGAMTGFLDLTYMNNPTGDVTVHGTEYSYGQTAKTWLQLIDGLGDFVNEGICYVDIYTPENEQFLERANMHSLEHDGIYYYDLLLENMGEGVYPVIALCYYEAGQVSYFASNYFTKIGTYDSGTIDNTYIIDGGAGLYLRFKEAVLNPVRNISVGLNVTNSSICFDTPEALLTGVTLRVVGRFDSVVNDDITISLWNYTSNSWLDLPNKILEGASYKDVSNSFFINNITDSGFVNSSGSNLKVLFTDTTLTDGATSNLDIDYLTFSCDQLADPSWQEVKGSSEIHISSGSTIPFYVETLCGSSEENLDSSGCSTFEYNPNIVNATWGYLQENLTFINNYQKTVSSSYVYETPLGQDCTGITSVTRTHNNITEDFYSNISYRSGSNDNCLLTIPVSFINSTDREFFIEIIQENYMLWEVERINDLVNYYRMPIESYCDIVAQQHNNPFIIPLTADNDISVLYASNPIYLGCYRSIDDIYWFDYYFNLSQNTFSSGGFESLLYNVRLYYEEIKDGSDAIQTITDKNILVHVNTLCGESSQYPNQYSCEKIMPPDSYFTSQEGYILQNLTVINDFNTTSSSYYSYQTAPAVDCSAVREVIKDNGTRTDIYDDLIFNSGIEGNCLIRIPIDNVQGVSSYNIELYLENYILWDIYWARDNVNEWNDTITPYCENISIDRNVSYTLPINSSIEYYRNDTELYSCYRALDDLYWWYYFYDQLQDGNFTMVGELVSYHYESEFFWGRIFDDYTNINNKLGRSVQINTLQEIYNLRDSINSSLNYSSIAESVWNYNNKSLDYYADTTNYSYLSYLIPSSVWSWTGGISSSILGFFTTDIWSYVNRTLSPSEYEKISKYVWNYSGDRNLTFYEVNNISPEEIWNYTSRNLTFTDDVYDYNLSAQTNWNYVDRNLTMYPIGNNLTVTDIWSYYNRSLSENIPLQVWSYQNRNLTTDLPFEVWSYSNRTLTYYTLNITELIEMLSNYNMTQISIPFPLQNNQYPSNSLNVILYVQK